VRKSRHFIPIAAAFGVVIIFAFLQYNRILISNVQAYVSPGAIDPQNIVVDPTADVKVGPEPRLIIPKINVDVPVVYGVPVTGNKQRDNDAQMKAMEKGVVHFAPLGANSVPGQVGNTVVAGHSSNDLFDPGDYKFIFAQNEKLTNGDTIYMNYQGKRYTYTIIKKEVVLPSNVQSLTAPTDKPLLTLISCVPLGTADKRLLIFAEQVSPDPAGATAASGETSTGGQAGIPGNSPTFVERLFGQR
jgi:sortase A